MKKFLFLTVACFFMYLICFPAQALTSAIHGLTLWYSSVVPVLFPFMLLCRLIIRLDLIYCIPCVFTKPLRFLFGCSHAASLAVIAGFFCGFPVGASFAFDLYQMQKITKKEFDFLLAFVNNLSPGFIISYLCIEQLKDPSLSAPAVCIVLGSALLYGFLLSRIPHLRNSVSNSVSCSSPQYKPLSDSVFIILDDAVYTSILNTLRLGGYIIFFSVLSDMMLQIPNIHPFLLLSAASIEITKGLNIINESFLSDSHRQILSFALAAFGGWSAAFQSAGVCRMNGLQFFRYIKSRAIITLLSVLLYFIIFFCIL